MTRFRAMRGLDIFLLLFATLVWAGPLVFNDTTGLPVCAYQCSALYTAQYGCATASSESEQTKCFCGNNSVQWKDGEDWTGCNDVCTDETDREKVDAWVEAICDSYDKNGQRKDNTNTTDHYITITDINPNEIEDDSTERAAAQATKVRDWWSRNYPFFVLAFLVITIPIICYAVAIPLRRWCKRQLTGRCPRSEASMGDIGPYTSVFAPTGSRHGEQQYVTTTTNGPIREHTVIIPQPAADYPIDPSIRQHSWEARVRHQFESKKPFVEKIMFWKK